MKKLKYKHQIINVTINLELILWQNMDIEFETFFPCN